jgi:transcriptional regulator with XRE-family HTH domain
MTKAKKTTQPKKHGRPKKEISADQENVLFELAGGLSQEQIADYLGMSRSVFIDRLRENEELSKQYKRGIATKYNTAVNKLWEHIDNGNVACLLFFMKTQMGWRELQDVTPENTSQPIKIQFIGADGKVVQPTKPIES